MLAHFICKIHIFMFVAIERTTSSDDTIKRVNYAIGCEETCLANLLF